MPVSFDMGIVVYGLHPGRRSPAEQFFPPTLKELVPEDYLVRVIEAYVARLNIQMMDFSKAQPLKTGRPAYDPADLLKLYLYGYFQRIRSSHRLKTECQRNIEVMWLLGRLAPNFKTIAGFRKDNSAVFQVTCKAFVQFCLQLTTTTPFK